MTRPTKDAAAVGANVPIKRLVLSDTVHARAVALEIDFVDIIGINIGGRQSPSMSDIDLMADISLGVIYFRVENRDYELSLRCIRIILEKDNALVQPNTYYRMVLQAGHHQTTNSEKIISRATISGDAAIGSEANASFLSLIPTLSAKIYGKATGKTDASRTAETLSQSESASTQELVYHSGQETWIAGGPKGDLRRHMSQDLRGEIIGDERAGPVPLCGLEAIDPNIVVSGRIRVRAGVEGIALNPSQNAEATVERLFGALQDDKLRALERRVKAERDLRRRVAALAMMKDNRKSGHSEVDLAVRSFVFEPEVAGALET